mgnify:CR=1 FL=1
MTSDSTPAFEIEKEALKTEIETGIQAGVDHLEAKTAKRKDADKYHNTRHLLKQYRKVAYAIQISEADMNVRMEMEHGTRLSTLEVNAELAGVDLSGSKLEGYSKTSGGMSNMGRFINLGIAIVNTSYIIRVEMESDGRAEIYMSDGTMFRCDHFDAAQLYGTNEKKEGATSLHLQEELRYDQSHSMST